MDLINLKAPILPLISINRKTVAKEVKGDIGILVDMFDRLNKVEILQKIVESGFYDLEYLVGKSFKLSAIDLTIEYEAASGFSTIERDNTIIILNTSRNENLITKGLIKDLARNIQQLRKELGYSPTEILDTAFISNFSIDETSKLTPHETELKALVRVKNLRFSSDETSIIEKAKEIDLDGKKIFIYVR